MNTGRARAQISVSHHDVAVDLGQHLGVAALGGEALVVDTGHVVAWESTLDYSIGGMGGLKQTLFSGEGLVMNFTGRGRIWLQTRTLGQTAGWLVPYLLR